MPAMPFQAEPHRPAFFAPGTGNFPAPRRVHGSRLDSLRSPDILAPGITMNTRLLTASFAASFAATTFAADEAVEKKPTRNETMRAQMVEDAKKQAAKPAAPASKTDAATTPAKSAPSPEPARANPALDDEQDRPTPPAPVAKAANEPATVLPQIEVNRSKLHPLARELYEKEKEISREQQLTKPTELDKALNNPKLSVPILGGQSTTSRASIASERTALLEAEADVIEEIGRARTKEQKAELRKQLDELKKVRRDLELAIR